MKLITLKNKLCFYREIINSLYTGADHQSLKMHAITRIKVLNQMRRILAPVLVGNMLTIIK